MQIPKPTVIKTAIGAIVALIAATGVIPPEIAGWLLAIF